MAKYEKKKKKKGYGKMLGFCGIVGCVAALLWGAGNFGLGGGLLPWGQAGGGNGSGSGNGGYASQNNQQQNTPPPGQGTNEDPGDNGNGEVAADELIIRVERDMIYHSERQITIDELVPLLESLNYPGAIWELHDDQAIVETYENVIALMRENGIEFIER